MKKRSKFGNEIVQTPEGKFHSAAEHRRWCDLKLLERAGGITALARQVPFELKGLNGSVIGRYTVDHYFIEGGQEVAEEFKRDGTLTESYELRRKLFIDNYPGISHREYGTSRGTAAAWDAILKKHGVQNGRSRRS